MGSAEVVGPDAVEQAKRRIVGQSKGFGIFTKLGDSQDRAEQFVIEQQVVFVNTGHHSGFHEGPIAFNGLSSTDDGSTHGESSLKFLKHFCAVRLMHKATDAHTFRHARSNLPLAHFSHDSFNEFVMDIFVDNESRSGPTHLSCIHEDTKTDGLGSIAKVRIREDDVGAFSTEFKRDWSEVFTGFCHDGLSCWYTAGQDHAIDASVACKCVTNESTRSGDHLEHARGEANVCFFHGLGPSDEREGGPGCWLCNHSASRSKRRCDGAKGELKWEVPRHDVNGDTQRLAQSVVQSVARDWNGCSFDFIRESSEVFEGPCTVANFRQCFTEGFAVVVGFNSGECLGVSVGCLCHFVQNTSALCGVHVLPRSIVECRT